MKLSLLLVLILITASLTIVAGANTNNEINGKYVQYWENGTSIQNFSVKLDGSNIQVINNISLEKSNFNGLTFSNFRIIDNFFTPIMYYGRDSIILSLNNNLEIYYYNYSNINYIRVTENSYFGEIITNGNVVLNQHNITISSSSLLPYSFEYVTAPISYFLSAYSNLENRIENDFGNYTISENGVSDYSLNGINASISIIKSIQSLNTSTNDNEEFEDSLIFLNFPSPSIVGTGTSYGYNITLFDPFSFVLLNKSVLFNASLPFVNSVSIPFITFAYSSYAIEFNDRPIGFARVFGNSYISGNSLVIPATDSFIIQFESIVNSNNSLSLLNNRGNISAEIYTNESPYFVVLSPESLQILDINATSNKIDADMYIYQNSTIEFIIPKGYVISNLVVNGTQFTYGNSTNGFVVVREGNQSIAMINVNSTGNLTLSISLLKSSERHFIPLFLIFLIAAIVLIIGALSLIYYARLKSIRLYEKNN